MSAVAAAEGWAAARPAPAAVLAREARSLEELRALIRVGGGQVVQLGTGPLQARVVAAAQGARQITWWSFSAGVRTEGVAAPSHVALSVPLVCAGVLAYTGRRVKPGVAIVFAPGARYDAHCSGAYEHLTLHLPVPDWEAACRRLVGGVPVLPERGQCVVRLPAGLVTRLPRLADAPAQGPLDGAAFESLLEGLLAALLPAVQRGTTLAPPPPGPERGPSYVQQAEAYLRAHPGETIYVGGLCAALGVSERTLQHAFRRELGLSPLGFLRRCRLHDVHRDLLAAAGRGGEGSVAETARRHGFLHLGRFAAEYRAVFGENPSQTLAGRGTSRRDAPAGA